MDRVIINNIPFEVDTKGMLDLLRLRTGTSRSSDFLKILDEARSIAAPKAAFCVAPVRITGDDSVEIYVVNFTSRVMRVNLENACIIYPFVATCGVELDEWSNTLSGTLQRFWADSIMLMALGCAVTHLEVYLKDRIGKGTRLSSMNPGSTKEWPLEEQSTLFSLLGDGAEAIGVSLTDKMVISPLKSISGIYFISEEDFINCSLCPRHDCTSRRVKYDPDLYSKRYKTPS